MKIAIAGKLINANIDLGKLKKGLKHIGLTLYKFEDIKEERIPELIGLF